MARSNSPQDVKQLQLVITAQKGVALDLDTLGRDSKTQSKELYIWGQEQAEDLKDGQSRPRALRPARSLLSTRQ